MTLSDKIAEVEKILAELDGDGWQEMDVIDKNDANFLNAAPTLIASMLEVVKAGYALLANMPINIPSNQEYPAVNRDFLNILNKALEKFAGNEGGG